MQKREQEQNQNDGMAPPASETFVDQQKRKMRVTWS